MSIVRPPMVAVGVLEQEFASTSLILNLHVPYMSLVEMATIALIKVPHNCFAKILEYCFPVEGTSPFCSNLPCMLLSYLCLMTSSRL